MRTSDNDGLDYADQRYYASSYGRFNTGDRKGGNGNDPGSLNKYAYVGGDPVNRNDPQGLCAVMISGFTMDGPGKDSTWDQEGTKLGADMAYPYPDGLKGSLASFAVQALTGQDAATLTAYNALTYALGTNSGPIDVVAYSGGAEAFATAWDMLSKADRSRIGNILYLSPGGSALPHNSQTSYVFGSGFLNNWIVQIGSTPVGGSVTNTDCGHMNINCCFGAASNQLAAIQADGTCSAQRKFTRTDFSSGWTPNPYVGVVMGSEWLSERTRVFMDSTITFGETEDE